MEWHDGPAVEPEREADDAILLSRLLPPPRPSIVVPQTNDWHPTQDSRLQVETTHTPNSASGISSAVEDTGDSLQLLDIAKKRLGSTDDQEAFEHTGAHLLTEDILSRPSQLPEDLEGDGLDITIDKLIRGTMLYAAGPDKLQFLPISELDTIVTIPNIIHELERAGETSDAHDLAVQVWCPQDLPGNKPTTRRKLFAILCHMNKATEIRTFIQEKVTDFDLPFEFEASQTLRRSGKPIELFTTWDAWHRESFGHLQGRFLAPYFKLSNDHLTKFRDYKLHRCVVLPFLEAEVKDSPLGYSIGGFSVVRKVKIHSAHHDYCPGLGSPEKVHFAVKRLQKTEQAEQSAQNSPNRETAAYKRLNRLQHPHIVRLLATYSHRDHLHMIFPWADGNLYQFWCNHFPSPHNLPRTPRLALWMIKQFVGLASALQTIQSPISEFVSEVLCPEDLKKNHGRHGDMKPENILWFKSTSVSSKADSLGNLVISDLGSTEFHGTLSDVVELTAAGGFTETYKAPEFDIMRKALPESDLWSFGCVLLQFIVWYRYGWAGVVEFTEARTNDSFFVIRSDQFFNFIKDENAVEAKPAVRKQFKKLREDPEVGDFILDLLDVIESCLLRIRSSKRASCEEIVAKLNNIQKLCQNSNYCTQRTTERISRAPTDLSDKVTVFLSSEMMNEYLRSVDPKPHVIPSRSTTQKSSAQGTTDGPSRETLDNGADDSMVIQTAPDKVPDQPVGGADYQREAILEDTVHEGSPKDRPSLPKSLWSWFPRIICDCFTPSRSTR